MQKTVRKTVYNDGETDVYNKITGEVLNRDASNLKITVEEFLMEEENLSECDAEFFMTDTTFIKSFRGNGIMLNQKLSHSEIAVVVFYRILFVMMTAY